MIRIFLFIILFLKGSHVCFGQSTDTRTWSSIQLTKTINAKSSYAIKPIIRHFKDLSDYQNSSLDFSYRHKLKKGWYLQGVTRYWFIPKATDRYFLWFDVGYIKGIKKSKLATFVRYHHAFDLKEQIDPDFLRWKANWSFPTIGKFTPQFAFEVFYRLNNINHLNRVRYEPGVKWAISDRIDFTAVYRRENFENENPRRKFDVGVFNLQFKL